jgi:hypothetical protein
MKEMKEKKDSLGEDSQKKDRLKKPEIKKRRVEINILDVYGSDEIPNFEARNEEEDKAEREKIEEMRKKLYQYEEVLKEKLPPWIRSFYKNPIRRKDAMVEINKAFRVKSPLMLAKARWVYAEILVGMAYELELSIFQIMKDLKEKSLFREGESDKGYRIEVGKKVWSTVELDEIIYKEVSINIRVVVNKLLGLAKIGKKQEREEKEGFKKGASFNLKELAEGKDGEYIIFVPDRKYPGGQLRLKSDGKNVTIENVIGRFASYVEREIMPLVKTNYKVEWIGRERIDLQDRRLPQSEFDALLWLHRAIEAAVDKRKEKAEEKKRQEEIEKETA